MPKYNLAAPEEKVVTTWLFEPVGYLDLAVRLDGQTARQALVADPTLDVTQWTRDNTPLDPTSTDWPECAMVWWIRANDGVNVTPPTRPPETAAWVATLQEWDASIDAGFARSPESARNATSVPLFDANGNPDGTQPAGAHLASQKNIISKVLGVLQ